MTKELFINLYEELKRYDEIKNIVLIDNVIVVNNSEYITLLSDGRLKVNREDFVCEYNSLADYISSVDDDHYLVSFYIDIIQDSHCCTSREFTDYIKSFEDKNFSE